MNNNTEQGGVEIVDLSTPEQELIKELNLSQFEPEIVERKAPTIIKRDVWGGIPPKKVEKNEQPLMKVFYSMYSESPACTTKEECCQIVKDLQRKHMEEQGLSDIKFNFLVGGDGNVYEGRGWDAKPSKSIEFNPGIAEKRLDIAFIGDFRNVPNPPHRQLEVALDLLAYGEFLKHVHRTRDMYRIEGDKPCDPPWEKKDYEYLRDTGAYYKDGVIHDTPLYNPMYKTTK